MRSDHQTEWAQRGAVRFAMWNNAPRGTRDELRPASLQKQIEDARAAELARRRDAADQASAEADERQPAIDREIARRRDRTAAGAAIARAGPTRKREGFTP